MAASFIMLMILHDTDVKAKSHILSYSVLAVFMHMVRQWKNALLHAFLSTSNSESAERRIIPDLTLLAFSLFHNAALRTKDLQERVQVRYRHPAVHNGDSSALHYFCRQSRRLHHHIP